MIKIQKENFQVDYEIEKIKSLSNEIGAVTNFIGYVRNINNSKKVKSIYVEVYEEMAIKSLTKLQVSKIDITSLLNFLIQKKVKIDIAPVLGKWCEIDSSKDLASYKKKTIKKNVWSHDWR